MGSTSIGYCIHQYMRAGGEDYLGRTKLQQPLAKVGTEVRLGQSRLQNLMASPKAGMGHAKLGQSNH